MWLSGQDPEARRQSQASLCIWGAETSLPVGLSMPTTGTPALNWMLWGLAYSTGQGLAPACLCLVCWHLEQRTEECLPLPVTLKPHFVSHSV